MSIRRVDSTFVIGFQDLMNKIELADAAANIIGDKHKGSDKLLPERPSAFDETEAFRTMTEHHIPINELCSILETSEDSGLTEENALKKLINFGPNKLTEKKSLPWYCVFLKTLFGWFSLLLWLGAFLSFVAYGLTPFDSTNLYLGLVLAAIVIMVACFTFYQESKSSSIMAGFKNLIPPITMVIRNGKEIELESSYLVPGDVVLLKAGAKIPADVRILEANNLKVDNSSLTGESEPQDRKVECTNEKSPLETKNLAFFGTTAFQGTGKAVVIRTGNQTVIGCIAKLAHSAEATETTLGKEIGRFVRIVSVFSISCGLTFFIAGLIIGYDMLTNMVNSIGIIVASVPEGLLITVTISLTITAKRMASKNVLVKNLQSVETLGSTTCICSDKTGTLTENKMTIVAFWYDLLAREVVNYQRRDEVNSLGYNPRDQTFKMIQLCATLNNKTKWKFEPEKKQLEDTNGHQYPPEEVQRIIENHRKKILESPIKEWPVMGGDASETAMIKFFHPITDIDKMRAQYPILFRNGVKGEIPFNSSYKYAVTIHEPVDFASEGHEKDCLLLMKGAPEQIWERCKNIYMRGEECPIKILHIEEFNKANKIYASQGRRVLGYAMYWLPFIEYDANYVFDASLKDGPNFPLTGLTFLGLTALEDPPKLRVKESVESCHAAGIKVVMVTGDQPLTAAAIARQVSIITVNKTVNELAEEKEIDIFTIFDESDGVIVHGEELSKYIEEDKYLPFLEQRLTMCLQKKEVVFARTSPAQKFMIVECAQKLKHIVAVTGDGVNDSPAIKKSDIGIAMAIVGSDVAKDAADMLLMDDNFASIVDAVNEGRKIFDNLGKSICYALAPNIPELFPFISLVVFQLPVPLSPVLILLVALGTDMWPSISLAYEEPELDIMFRKPRNAQVDHLVSAKLLSHSYIQMGVFQSMAGFFTYFTVMYDYGFAPSNIWFLALSTEGTQPKSTDVYNPQSPYNGNTNVGNKEYDGIKIDWTYTDNAKYDLRVYFWRIKDWAPCRYPDDRSSVTGDKVCYTTEGLKYAQFAYFLAIVVAQWANLICVKTKRVSIFDHGLRNTVSIHGAIFETLLSIALAFIPGFDVAFGGRRVQFLHFFIPAFPFFMYILIYDGLRKYAIRYQTRNHKEGDSIGWFERTTLY